MSTFDNWVALARAVPIGDVLAGRGIRLTAGSKKEPHGPCPRCAGEDRFFVRARQQRFACRHCLPSGGDVIDLVRWLDGCDFLAACETLTGKQPPPREGNAVHEIVVAEFSYESEAGNLLFAVERLEFLRADGGYVLKDGRREKTFRQKRPDPTKPGKWIYNIDGVRPVPYRLPELVEAIAQQYLVFVVESEPKADALAALGLPATCNAMGAGNWKPEHVAFFRGADCILVPDNDDAGFAHINGVGASLAGIAARVRVLILPGLPVKGDVVDWFRAGGTREQLDALVADAPLWMPPPKTDKASDEQRAKAQADEQKLIDELSRLSAFDYDRQRNQAARDLGVRRGSIDREVEARRQQRQEEAGPAPLFGHWEVEPWPEPIDLAELLDDTVKQIKRYNVLPDHFADTVAMWIQYAWNFEHATHGPILRIASAEFGSGKTTLLGTINFLVPRPLQTVGISEAALYRSVEQWSPVVLIDEADTLLVENEPLRSLVNSAWTRGSSVVRCIGKDKEPHAFSTFTPIALAMNGKRLPGATKSRTIEIWMQRKLKSETCEHFNHLDNNEFGQLRQRSLRSYLDTFEALKRADPIIPSSMDGRIADNYRLQFAIADLAGGSWPERARSAAMKITGAVDVSGQNTRLLAAIKAIYYARLGEEKKSSLTIIDHSVGRIFIGTGHLIEALLEDPASEFREWHKGKPISQHQLWRVLTDFGISSTPDTTGKVRGFYGWQFEDAWERYL